MRSSTTKTSLKVAAFAGAMGVALLASSAANAATMYFSNGTSFTVDWLSLEQCNFYTSGSGIVCFMDATAPGNSTHTAYALIKGKKVPLVTPDEKTERRLGEIVRQKKSRKAVIEFQRTVSKSMATFKEHSRR